MAIAPGESSTQSTGGGEDETDFGANDWLLEEMYERYTADPASVDASWAEYFASHAPGRGTGIGQTTARSET
ncbi:2-oxoglutarate dehydrogenase E1 subunit family protein, partial [Klebsiella pneumoniae]|uniref:2-oxoglutarate dehydrogenase E1 subunit family protein n=1 Tax=Klebsiella pneumoniae TaxID=573 RepID=UPI001C557BBF